jgi:hypothetical protein
MVHSYRESQSWFVFEVQFGTLTYARHQIRKAAATVLSKVAASYSVQFKNNLAEYMSFFIQASLSLQSPLPLEAHKPYQRQ